MTMTRSLMFLAAMATTMIAAPDGPSTAQSPDTPAPSSQPADVARRAPDQPRFKSGIDLVSLDVCVRDSTGRFLPDLTPDDFLVAENGKLQRISFVIPSSAVPLTAILLIDRSASMYGSKLERAMEAAQMFARSLEPGDRLEIIAFNHQAERVHAFGDEPSRLPAALASVRATGSTALYDALLVAANEMARARRGALPETREAVIVLSDGEDTASRVGFEEVLPALRRSGALVYTLSIREGEDGEWLGASWPLLELARDTGAVAVGVTRLDRLPALYAEIGAEVRHLYRIGYTSNDERRDGQWRTVSVGVRSRDANVRTRAGYYASRSRESGAQP